MIRKFGSGLCFLLVAVNVNLSSLHGQSLPTGIQFKSNPERVILFIIDGLSYKIWERLDLTVLEQMRGEGTVVERMFLPPPAHPHTGRYAKLHTCSTPNPILMSGTLFIEEKTEFIQDQFANHYITAFIGNATAYRSVNRNYDLVYQKGGSNAESLRVGKAILKLLKPNFMRLHLQDSGGAGRASMTTSEDVPWRGNIWAEGAPYVRELHKADQILGELVSYLKILGLLETTAIFIMGDHGQADTCWHSPEIYDAAITTLVMWGAGIEEEIQIPYGEIIDVVPTICHLMSVPGPAKAQGRILAQAVIKKPVNAEPVKRTIEKMLKQFEAFRKLSRETAFALERVLESESGLLFRDFDEITERFFDMDRFLDWYTFSSVEDLLQHNDRVTESLQQLRRRVADSGGS